MFFHGNDSAVIRFFKTKQGKRRLICLKMFWMDKAFTQKQWKSVSCWILKTFWIFAGHGGCSKLEEECKSMNSSIFILKVISSFYYSPFPLFLLPAFFLLILHTVIHTHTLPACLPVSHMHTHTHTTSFVWSQTALKADPVALLRRMLICPLWSLWGRREWTLAANALSH